MIEKTALCSSFYTRMQWVKEIPENVLNMWIGSFLLGTIIPFFIYWMTKKKYSYWRDRGVKYAEPESFFESLFLPAQKSNQEVQFERYNQLGRIYGLFDAAFAVGQPAITIGDPELLRDIMVKDFHFFPNRRDLGIGDDSSVFSRMLILLRDEDWKRVRSVVSPAFSTGKIKRVLDIFKESSKTLLQNFKMAALRRENIEIKSLYGAFAMDVIASAAFSIKIDSHNNAENTFVTEARKVVSTSQGRVPKLLQKLPALMRKYAVKLATLRFKFFIDITLEVISERKRTGESKNDFLQLLIDAANETEVEECEESEDIAVNYGDDSTNHQIFKTAPSKRISKDEVVAQSLIFFLAGYHSTATTLSMASYLMALNFDAQRKAYQEIKEVLKETNGELTYESMHKMKMIDNIISETLRLYPPFPTIERIAATGYDLGQTGITIPKGMTVEIPIYSMNRDPEYFPNPENFDPDRFNPEQRSHQTPYSYLPFGAGPRNCIGMRFALLELKVCLINVISAFKIRQCPKTKIPLKFVESRNFLQTEDIILQMELREDCPLKD